MYLNEYAVTAYVGSNMYSRVHKIDAPSAGERREGKIHRNDPDFGSTLTVSNRDSQSDCWVDWKIMGQPCEFQVETLCGLERSGGVFPRPYLGEKDAKLGQLQPFLAVFPQEYMGQLGSFGPT
jgi:hypothetical protein